MPYSDNAVTEKERTAMYTMATGGWIEAALALLGLALGWDPELIKFLLLAAAVLLMVQMVNWRARDEFFERLCSIAMRCALGVLAVWAMIFLWTAIMFDGRPTALTNLLGRIDVLIAIINLVYFGAFSIARKMADWQD